MAYWGLLKRKNTWVVTWRGWMLALAVTSAALVFAGRHIHPFLAMNSPTHGDILVVEGWIPDSALEQAATLFDKRGYRLIVTAGGPLAKGSHLSEYSTYAELSAATLRRLGVKQSQIVSVPAPSVRTDRTFASALAVKAWLSQSNMAIDSLDVFSLDTHARRTHWLFQSAIGDKIAVGVIAARPSDYNAEDWWSWSSGVRSVISETVAYLYARFLFSPSDECGVPMAKGS